MLDLTFGEQVKIILSRKGMTIKELAELIEDRTGKKMSRQNLTQRLGRDNFQEQDMRMIAEILECPFQLSILADSESVERASHVETVEPTEKELTKLARAKERKERREEMKEAAVVADPVEEVAVEEPVVEESVVEEPVQYEEEPVQYEEEPAAEEPVVEETPVAAEPERKEEKKAKGGWRSVFQRRPKKEESVAYEAPVQNEEPVVEEEPAVEEEPVLVNTPTPENVEHMHESYQNAVEEMIQNSEEEDLDKGEINPYTGREFETNTVRSVPNKIGYVEVYDRGQHKWERMTEWAFLGLQDDLKAHLGDAYKEPIYLD